MSLLKKNAAASPTSVGSAFGALFAVVAVAAASFAIAAAVHAQTYTTTAVTTSYGGIPSYGLFSNLTVGSSNQEVYDLQSFLAEQGYFTYGLPTGYFGPITKTALASYQRANGLPSTGYFGPMTRATMSSYVATFAVRLGLAVSGSTATGITIGLNTGSLNPVSTNGSSVSASTLAPLHPTGYWLNGNWYNSVPTTTVGISGYWYNGTYYPASSSANPTANQGSGYWYDGVWYSTSNSSQNMSSTVATNAQSGISTSSWSPYSGTSSTTGTSCSYQQTATNGTQYVCQ
ncbi:MAG: peptidoglycan-binding protein [Patescibacteria group bacterium]|nr:peptidoglycan-binding protein [Patescibacteria group bacterium]MDE2116406.1 peptidoglycan-binding protein [Patescibacteria group bacterium]